MKVLVVVPCGKRKIWDKHPERGPTKAREAYIGAPFIVNREYAEKFGDEWVILSAKYGFIEPDFIILKNYDVTFDDRSTKPISIEQLKKQVDAKFIGFHRVTALGSRRYAEIVLKAFEQTKSEINTPSAGLSVGYAMGKVKDAIRNNRPLSSV
jgi:hypothetical protein